MKNAEHNFGGPWSEDKLRRISAYLKAYNTALKNQPFTRIYVDAFAGSGEQTPKAKRKSKTKKVEQGTLAFDITTAAPKAIKGSTLRALEVDPPFHRFIFIEKSRNKRKRLEAHKAQYPNIADKIAVVGDDANSAIKKLCKSVDWKKSRAVLFLDPFGMQVDWKTLEAVAQTQAIDVWYLIPVGMGIVRLVTKDGKIPPKWAARLTKMLGEEEWRAAFYRDQENETLFGKTSAKVKATDTTRVEKYLVARLKTIFPSVAEQGLILRNSLNQPMFLLMFACANKRGGPIALRIAEQILGKPGAKHGRQ